MSEPIQPAWHDRPTGPGLWVCANHRDQWNVIAVRLDADEIARGAPFHTCRVYGPIPEDEVTE